MKRISSFTLIELPAVSKRKPGGFTLVELLVVITIIAVLLALLAPAMDRAVYQAELAVCASRLHAVATGTDTYAAASNRAYPYRPTLREGTRWLRGVVIATQSDTGGTPAKDDRPYLRRAYGDGLKSLVDPLGGKINPDHNLPSVDTYANYSLWFGVGYPKALGGGRALLRQGDRMEWTDNSRSTSVRHSFSVLASDLDAPYPIPDSYWQVLAGHPDADGVLWFLSVERTYSPPQGLELSQGYVLSWWGTDKTVERGPIDTNYAFTDGSVVRYNAVAWDDEQMARVPWSTSAWGWNSGSPNHWHHLPRR